MKAVIGFLILSASGFLPLAYGAEEEKSNAGDEVSTIDPAQIITVTTSKQENSLTIGGTVISGKQVVMNAEHPGRVQYIAGDVGDMFDTNTTLVQLDDTGLIAREDEAYYQINIARADLRDAEVQYERALVSPDYNPMMGNWSKMFNRFDMDGFFGGGDRGMERYSNVHAYRTRVEQAGAVLRQAESRLRQIKSKIRDSRTIAPFDGVIVKKNIEAGDTVMPGQPLIEFADLGWLQMVVDVPVRIVSSLREGMRLPAKLERRLIEVEVYRIYPVADIYKHTVKVELDLPYNIHASPGMYAEVMVTDKSRAGRREHPVVPRSAVIWRGTLPAVYKLNGKGKPELRLIRIGERFAGNVQVLSGIRPGDQIIAGPKAKGWGKDNGDNNFAE